MINIIVPKATIMLIGKRSIVTLIIITIYVCFVWSGEREQSSELDYAQYASVLADYVNDTGGVNYKALNVNRVALDSFTDSLAGWDQSVYDVWTENDQLAFWINAYNAFTLKVILDNYPIKASFLGSLRFPKNSIRQISGVWDKIKFNVMGRNMTLNDIEHNIIRKKFAEPRIHFALVCASGGCPPLRNEPFIGKKLEDQLDDQVRDMIAVSSKFRVDHSSKTIFLSKILEWYGDDFISQFTPSKPTAGNSDKQHAATSFLAEYVDEPTKNALLSTDYSVSYLKYDWSLNQQ